jgi:membrane protein required for beta-lactamase induction
MPQFFLARLLILLVLSAESSFFVQIAAVKVQGNWQIMFKKKDCFQSITSFNVGILPATLRFTITGSVSIKEEADPPFVT